MFEKNLALVPLFDAYGELLPEQKQKMFELYYGDDLSLSEIAEEMGISRQGVRDSIKKCEEQLLFFEEKLGLVKKMQKIADAAEKLRLLGNTDSERAALGEIADALDALI